MPASQPQGRIETHTLASLLRDISLDLTREQNVLARVQKIIDYAVDLLAAHSAALYLLDDSRERATLIATSRPLREFIGRSITVGSSLVGLVIKDEAVRCVPDYRSWPYRLDMYEGYGFTTVAGAPITWQGNLWGVITARFTEAGRAFSDADLDLLSHLGNLAALAFESARRTDELKVLMSTALDAIIQVNLEGIVVKFNEQAEKILGYSLNQVLGRSVKTLYTDPNIARIISRLLYERGGELRDYDTWVLRSDGARVPIRLSAIVLVDQEGKRSGSVGFFKDRREIARLALKRLTAATGNDAATLDHNLRDIVQILAQNLGHEWVGIHLVDRRTRTLKIRPYYAGTLLRLAEIEEVALGHGITGWVALHGRPRLAPDVRLDEFYICGDPDVRSEMCVPLWVDDEVIGVIDVQSVELAAFTERDVEELAVIAQQVASIVRGLAESRQRIDDLTLLSDVARAASLSLELGQVLQQIAETVQHGRGYEALTIRLVNEGAQQLTGPYYFAGRPLQTPNPRLDTGHVGRMFQTQRTVWAPDVNQEPDYITPLPGVVAEILTPLKVDGAIIGLLSVHSSKEGVLNEADVRLLETIARQVERCIENARLYGQLGQTVLRLQATLADAQYTGLAPPEGTHFAASALAHELGKYADAIRNYVATLRLHGHHAKELDNINENAIKIQQMLDFPYANWSLVELMDVNEILSDLARRMAGGWGARLRIEQHLDAHSPFVKINRQGFIWSLDCLMDNALKSLDTASQAVLTLSSARRQDCVEIRVMDTGPGIPRPIQEKLFKKPIDKRDGEFGSGKALLTIRKFIAFHGGTIAVEKTGADGTTMLVTLPLAARTKQ